jgi:hypothetical protein
MAESLFAPLSAEAQIESKACSNRAAFRLWAGAHGYRNDPCEPVGDESGGAALIHAFLGGRRDVPARLLAGLLLSADLRPDDRLWVEGELPSWLGLGLSFTAGFAVAPEQASVWVAAQLPSCLPHTIRRVILTSSRPGQEAPPPGITLSCAADWA